MNAFRRMAIAVLVATGATAASAELVIYPEYPPQIERDYAYAVSFALPNDGAWNRYEADIDIDFDMAETELAALFLSSGIPADEIRFRNLSLGKCRRPSGHCD